MRSILEFLAIWGILIVVFYLSQIESKFSLQFKRIIVLILIVSFSMYFSCRTVGMDLRNYEIYYNANTAESLKSMLRVERIFFNRFEPIYTLWIYISKQLGLTFQGSLFVYTAVPLLVMYEAVFKREKNIFTVFALFMMQFVFQVDLTRHFFAVPFYIIGLLSSAIVTKLVCYSMSFFSHFSSGVSVGVEVYNRTFLKRINLFAAIGAGTLIAIIFEQGIYRFIGEDPNNVLFKIKYYLEGGHYNYVNALHWVLNTAVGCIPTLTALCAYYVHKKELYMAAKENPVLISSVRLGIVLSSVLILGFGSYGMANRIMLLMGSPMFLLFFRILEKEGKITNRSALVVSKKKITFVVYFMVYNIAMTLYYVLTALQWKIFV